MEVLRVACFLVITVIGITHGNPTGLDNCLQCQDMVASVKEMLSDRMPERMLRALCEAFSIDSAEMCSELSHSSPSELCQRLGYCAPRSPVYESDSDSDFNTELEIADKPGNSIVCVMCVNAMDLVHGYIKNKDNQKFLLHTMQSLCHFVPFITKECVHIVDTYGKMAIELLAHYLSPELCKLFHICPAGQAMVGDECKLCRFGVGVIYDAVQDPALETRLEQFVQELCADYASDDDECETFAKELTQYMLPMAEELRHSDFFKNSCERSGICSDDRVTFY